MGDAMLFDEKLLSLEQAGKCLPGRPSRTTLWRWCRKGLNGVKLEYRRMGRKILTSQEALERFTLSLAAADEPIQDLKATAQAMTERDRQIERARRELALAGI